MTNLFLLLSMSAFCISLPIMDDTLGISSKPPEFTSNTSETKTFPASDVFIFSNLLPPASMSDCLSSGYCNQGKCVQGITSTGRL